MYVYVLHKQYVNEIKGYWYMLYWGDNSCCVQSITCGVSTMYMYLLFNLGRPFSETLFFKGAQGRQYKHLKKKKKLFLGYEIKRKCFKKKQNTM